MSERVTPQVEMTTCPFCDWPRAGMDPDNGCCSEWDGMTIDRLKADVKRAAGDAQVAWQTMNEYKAAKADADRLAEALTMVQWDDGGVAGPMCPRCHDHPEHMDGCPVGDALRQHEEEKR